MNRLSKEQFIDRCYKAHGDQFGYSKTSYVNWNTKVTVECRKHGSFSQLPGNHLRYGCKQCSDEARKDTRFSFIEKSQLVHQLRYDYANIKYCGSREPVEIICREHGTFFQTPRNHLQGQGCPQCAKWHFGKAKRISQEEFVARAQKFFGNAYDFSECKYKNSRSAVIINCKQHGQFSQQAALVLKGHCGCRQCFREAKQDSTEDFVYKARMVHGSRYDYSRVDYGGYNVQITIVCRTHGGWHSGPDSHLKGHGCPKCARHDRKWTTREFIARATKIHGKFYDYSETVYTHSTDHIKIICRKHGPFWTLPAVHLKGQCPRCASGGSVSKISGEWLDFLGLPAGRQHREVNLKIAGETIRVDGFSPNNAIVYEFHGDFWHGNPNVFDLNHMNQIRKCTFGELLNETIRRRHLLEGAGYTVVEMWESDWKIRKRELKIRTDAAEFSLIDVDIGDVA